MWQEKIKNWIRSTFWKLFIFSKTPLEYLKKIKIGKVVERLCVDVHIKIFSHIYSGLELEALFTTGYCYLISQTNTTTGSINLKTSIYYYL
jgi:hypothetical protein